MGDLSRSLVDAAADAMECSFSPSSEGWRAEAEATVAAVLETLADHYFTHGGNHTSVHIEHLRKLAAEVGASSLPS